MTSDARDRDVHLEKVARALFDEFYRPAPELAAFVDDSAWDDLPDSGRQRWRRMVAAAIEALGLTAERRKILASGVILDADAPGWEWAKDQSRLVGPWVDDTTGGEK